MVYSREYGNQPALVPFSIGFECPIADLVTSRAGSFVTDPVNEPHYVGTVATFSCDSGYVVVGMPTRRCELITGWTGENPGCSKLLRVFSLNPRCVFPD